MEVVLYEWSQSKINCKHESGFIVGFIEGITLVFAEVGLWPRRSLNAKECVGIRRILLPTLLALFSSFVHGTLSFGEFTETRRRCRLGWLAMGQLSILILVFSRR